MNVEWLIVLVVIIMAIALVATLQVGFSRGNKEENPDYMKKTGRNWAKLSALYAVCVIVVVLVFVVAWGS